ncbi:MAG: aldose 1-epimerase family protein [Lachnospiraceae bacterium]|nr:aldose 1-epimerase family protein [Lachnospiraceae bacterium]
MSITIRNEFLTVTAAEKGAELQSVKSADGTEYLWQGDPAYWTSHAPNIFPYVARLTEGKYILNGREYGFGNHGLVRYEELAVEEQTDTSVTFRLDSTEETKKKYPFDFVYRISYTLDGNTLKIGTRVENAGEGRMYFAVGGHPGFNVPMEAGTSFTDYCRVFDEEAHPYRIHLADSGAVTPLTTVYEMKDNKVIPLSHDLFDHDAVVLTHAAKTVKICSDRTSRAVTVSYPDFRYVGFWHKPKTDAPYVCVEPWTSLPSREGIVEKLALQADLLSLDPGKVWETVWTVTID